MPKDNSDSLEQKSKPEVAYGIVEPIQGPPPARTRQQMQDHLTEHYSHLSKQEQEAYITEHLKSCSVCGISREEHSVVWPGHDFDLPVCACGKTEYQHQFGAWPPHEFEAKK